MGRTCSLRSPQKRRHECSIGKRKHGACHGRASMMERSASSGRRWPQARTDHVGSSTGMDLRRTLRCVACAWRAGERRKNRAWKYFLFARRVKQRHTCRRTARFNHGLVGGPRASRFGGYCSRKSSPHCDSSHATWQRPRQAHPATPENAHLLGIGKSFAVLGGPMTLGVKVRAYCVRHFPKTLTSSRLNRASGDGSAIRGQSFEHRPHLPKTLTTGCRSLGEPRRTAFRTRAALMLLQGAFDRRESSNAMPVTLSLTLSIPR